ncbi:class I adenylate-forming enzyme family protein [Arthrobacter sulfonylureivorans]|uniref:Acyl--CoA ligase n=1 Tax=Arthrobacter sulfonylureivorans TaxID=2486855 RepID=A0ABY3WD01_9MICC|nr:class I adenylate-forming enzyme family protein [Arthrobacter sulfonylureivorans]UNK47871.1 acyl--CoA ligase [Arthrobacter sulfonylureivorans]
MNDSRLWRALTLAVERFPNRTAIWTTNRHLSYQEWYAEIQRVAGGLLALGVSRGDRVAIGMRNSIAHATLQYAAQMIGACAVPFNYRLKPAGVKHVLEDSGSKVVVVDDAVSPDTTAKLRGQGVECHWVRAKGDPAAFEHRFEDLDGAVDESRLPNENDLSAIIYTSGTTGLPKGVPVTHRAVYERIITHTSTVGPHFDDGTRTVGATPLYHTVGLHWLFYYTVFVGGTYYPFERIDAETAEVVKSERLTYMHAPPTLYRMLISHLGASEKLESFREVVFGSAPGGAEFLELLFERFPNALVHEGYGTTELSIPFMTSSMAGQAPGTLRLAADQRVRIVTSGGGADDLVRPGEVGELLVDMLNPGVFEGYWGANAAKTVEKVDHGWFRTGDLFRADSDGNYFYHGRLDEMFRSGAESIKPAEVEATLMNHPDVVDAAVIGVPDESWGNVVTAVIVRGSAGTSEEALDLHCRSSDLEDYKRPRRYVFVASIPRSPSGKIVRGEVRSMATIRQLIS